MSDNINQPPPTPQPSTTAASTDLERPTRRRPQLQSFMTGAFQNAAVFQPTSTTTAVPPASTNQSLRTPFNQDAQLSQLTGRLNLGTFPSQQRQVFQQPLSAPASAHPFHHHQQQEERQQQSRTSMYQQSTRQSVGGVFPISTNVDRIAVGSDMLSSALDGIQSIWNPTRDNRVIQSAVPFNDTHHQQSFSPMLSRGEAFSFSPTTASYAPQQQQQQQQQQSEGYGLFSGGFARTLVQHEVIVSPTTIQNTLNVSGYHQDTAFEDPENTPLGPQEPGKFPERPMIGTKGRQIAVRANFFEFSTLPGRDLHQYDVKITPEVPPSLSRRIFRDLMDGLGSKAFGGIVAVYDGRRSLYSPKPLPIVDTVELEVVLKERADDPSGPTKSLSARKFTFRIKHHATVDMSIFKQFLQGKIVNSQFDALNALDVIMRHRPSLSLTSVGRSFFTRNDVKALGDGAECWMGFHQSVSASKGRLLMNIDISATAFYEPGPILTFIAHNLGKRAASDLRSPLKQRELEKIDRMLRGVKVLITHRGEMKRKYKITGLTRTSTDMTFFKYTPETRAGGKSGIALEISVAEYFARHYNVILQFPYLPCAKVGTAQRTVYLPLEVCDIVAGQRFLRKLNEQQTAQMIRLTCQTPDRRAAKISQAIGELSLDMLGSGKADQHDVANTMPLTDDLEYLDSFGVHLTDEMITIPARILDPPTLQYHPSSREPQITPRDGSWNLRAKKVVQPATLHSWAIVCFGSPREMPQEQIDNFLRELISTCRETGLTITNAHPPALYCDPASGKIEESVQAAWQAAGEAVQSFPQLIMCILPNTSVPLYAEIKRIGDTVLGVATQCLQVKHTYQPKKQYCANVCLKINAKLGGVNSFIVKNPAVPSDAGLPWVSDEPTMIFGSDITHPAHGESRENGSVCALVGSLDRLASRYAATVRLQPPRREVMAHLTSMVQELLKIFYLENNQIAPQRILFYRDGVSEGKFYEVVTKELKMIREACEQLQAGYCPAITYVIVQKRHHARVFVTNPADADRSGNIPSGTVIDSHIVHPNQYDFYLCSHAGLQGTSRPTHYYVLHDENGFTSDRLQELTYRLCFGYARCTRSVSVVPPAYYADLVAFRAKYHMKNGSNFSSGLYTGPFGTASVLSTGNARDPSQDRSSVDTDDAASEGTQASANQELKARRRAQRDITAEDDEELMKRLQQKLAIVKPELQKVMYFM